MYYVKENRDFPKSFTINGETWNYQRTDTETEYSYRANQYRDRADDGTTTHHQRHKKTIGTNGDISSIPEVLGKYKDDNGGDEDNEFLEFDFYNVYAKDNTPPPEPERRTIEIELDKKWDNNGDTTAPSEGSVAFNLHQIKIHGNSQTPDVEGSGFPKTLTVYAQDGWKLSVPNLPSYEIDSSGVTTYKYWLEEISLSDEVDQYRIPSFTNGYGSQNDPIGSTVEGDVLTVEVTNKTGNVIKVQKRWIGVDPNNAPPVTVRLWRQEIDAQGNPQNGEPVQVGNPIVLTHEDSVEGTAWWEKGIPYPAEKPSNPTHKYFYFLSEDNLNASEYQAYSQPKFYKIVGDQVISDEEAYLAVQNPRDFGNHAYQSAQNWRDQQGTSEIEDTTLMVMNTPSKTFDNVGWIKRWFVPQDNGQIVEVSSDNNPIVSKYAVGLQIYQRLGENGTPVPFTGPFYIAQSDDVIQGKVIYSADNTFKINDLGWDNGKWKMNFIKDDQKTGQGLPSGFPEGGFNTNSTWEKYYYEIKEIGVYTGSHATSAEQLTRVLDYSNVKAWGFDKDNTDRNNEKVKGINYPAGELDVTKKWEGGHEGSRIYFRVFRDDDDITSEIVNNPEQYGLTEHQVYKGMDDSGNPVPAHDSLIVKCTPDGGSFVWETLKIKGLQIATFNSNGQKTGDCSYSIKEIGYSEADGANFWDGDQITAPNGLTEKFRIGDLLTGYQVNGGNEMPGEVSPSVDFASNGTQSIQINNKYKEKYKDFEFTKVWQNQAGDFLSWPTDVTTISVDLYANGNKIVDGIQLFLTPPDQNATQQFTYNGVTYTWQRQLDASGTRYTFRIANLPAKYNDSDAEYSVKEAEATGFTISYGSIVDDKFKPSQSLDHAGDGQVISNLQQDQGVELPNTGGFGTTTLTIFAIILIAIAGVVFILGQNRPHTRVRSVVRNEGTIGGRGHV